MNTVQTAPRSSLLHILASKREAQFVALTLLAMLGGLFSSYWPDLHWLTLALYVAAFILGGWYGLLASLQAIREGAIEVDLLMILAALGAGAVGAPFEGAMLLFLFSLSNVLQDYAIGRSRDAIQSLMKLRPTQALARRGDATEWVPIESLAVGDRVLLRPGDRVPLDGTVVEGSSATDESSLTGESMPVTKGTGDHVFAGTINQTGSLELEVTRLAQDSTIAKLIKLVEEAQSEKADTQRFLDRAERYYAAGVIVFTIALIALGWLVFAEPFNKAFYRAMTAMVVASPCALVISTPASILSAIANGARKGVLFKGGAHLERIADVTVVAFDKTGTLTEGRPAVTDVTVVPMFDTPQAAPTLEPASYTTVTRARVHRFSGNQENTLLLLAAAVEAKSEHPLAQAIVKTAQERQLSIPEATQFQSITGRGVQAQVSFMGGMDIAIGSPRFFEGCVVSGLERALDEVQRLQDEGKTSVIVCKAGDVRATSNREDFVVLGVIAIADVLRAAAVAVTPDLKRVGVSEVVMLTGDNARVAHAIGAQAGVDAIYADLLPQDKVTQIKRLQTGNGVKRAVLMVGDGVNDAPALASATLGMAMGAAGTDVALETADVVLMANDLSRIPYAIALGRQARKVVIQNLAFSLCVIISLLIATLVAEPLGFRVPLPLGVVGHEGSTVLVCLNGLRLLGFDWKPERKA